MADLNDPIPSAQIMLARHALRHSIDQHWVDWAVSLLVAGYDTPNLRILAGVSSPFDALEMRALADRVLSELRLRPISDPKEAASVLTTELCRQLLAGTASIGEVLQQIKDVCIELDEMHEFMDFYLLHFARCDLVDDEVQWYWDGATRENIDEIVRECCRKWLADHGGST